MPAYLDHAASSPMRHEALEAFAQAAQIVGNPSSLHRFGQRARAELEEAREELAAAVGAHPEEVIFTSGGSEADTLAVLGTLSVLGADPRSCLVSAVEHPAVLEATKRGARELPVTRAGSVDLEQAARLIDANTRLVSVQWVNNETGVVQPVEAVRSLAAAQGARMHSDAVQALGHLPLSFRDSQLDLLSLSAHKVGGPVGIGALLARRDATPAAVGLGGGQERGVRSGTVPVALAASFARAATLAVSELADEGPRLTRLRDEIADLVVGLGGRLNSSAQGAPHIVNVTFDAVRADDLLFLLDRSGVHASVGSACRAGVHQPSEVLLAMGASLEEATGSLRFSLGRTSTDADVELLAQTLPSALERARGAYAQPA